MLLPSLLAGAIAVPGHAFDEHDYPIRPVVANQVGVDDGFWRPRLETNRAVTIPFALRKCEETQRIENFKVAGGLSDKAWGSSNGYDDSDVSKVIEGAAYSLMTHPDPALAARLAEIASYYAAAQEDDGYLYTLWTARNTVDIDQVHCSCGSGGRWDHIEWAHQLYDAGHMYEAGVAHFQATGDPSLLEVCRKNADCIAATFGPGKIELPPGHQEIEIGLAKLARATHDTRYLDLARYFLDLRGRTTPSRDHTYGTYCQDHEPVVEQSRGVGHAVRATYMYSAMADIAAMTGDHAYIEAIERIWQHVVTRQMYLTGGIGAAGDHEGFGPDYELPNLSAYCETCAAIGMCMWNHRMFLMSGDARSMDVLERTLYNGVLSGVSMDGESFFYPNPLESDGRHARSPWFGTSCCPSNLCRFIPSVPGYAYAQKDDDLYVNLYFSGSSEIALAGGKVKVGQNTSYPWDGRVTLKLAPEHQGQSLTLRLRVPGWARNQAVPGDLYRFADTTDQVPTLAVNGERVPLALEAGYAVLSSTWNVDDTVTLDLPMPVRRVLAHDAVKEDAGKAAFQRGPLVYCIEHPDVADGQVADLVVPLDAAISTEFRADLLGGVQVLTGEAEAYRFALAENGRTLEHAPVTFTAIPYYAWAHRGRGEMSVWIAHDPRSTRPLPAPTLATRAEASASRGDAQALADQREPANSNDHSNRFLHNWPQQGTLEWVQYDWPEPIQASAVEVYWFDDQPRGGGCRIPASWRLLFRQGDEWLEVPNASAYHCTKDQYNRCTFDAVTTSGLRIEMQLQEHWSAGVHEWRVE